MAEGPCALTRHPCGPPEHHSVDPTQKLVSTHRAYSSKGATASHSKYCSPACLPLQSGNATQITAYIANAATRGCSTQVLANSAHAKLSIERLASRAVWLGTGACSITDDTANPMPCHVYSLGNQHIGAINTVHDFYHVQTTAMTGCSGGGLPLSQRPGKLTRIGRLPVLPVQYGCTGWERRAGRALSVGRNGKLQFLPCPQHMRHKQRSAAIANMHSGGNYCRSA